jgi:hypothetical protein
VCFDLLLKCATELNRGISVWIEPKIDEFHAIDMVSEKRTARHSCWTSLRSSESILRPAEGGLRAFRATLGAKQRSAARLRARVGARAG